MGNCLSDLTGDDGSSSPRRRTGKKRDGNANNNNTSTASPQPGELSTTRREASDESEETAGGGKKKSSNKKKSSAKKKEEQNQQERGSSGNNDGGGIFGDTSVRSNSNNLAKSSNVAPPDSPKTTTKQSPQLKPVAPARSGTSESSSKSTPRLGPSTPLMLLKSPAQSAALPQPPASPLLGSSTDRKPLRSSPSSSLPAPNPLIAPQRLSTPASSSNDSPLAPPPRMLTFARATSRTPDESSLGNTINNRRQASSARARGSPQMHPVEQIGDTITVISTSDQRDSRELSGFDDSATGAPLRVAAGRLTREGSTAAPTLAITAPSNGELLRTRAASPQTQAEVTTPNLPISTTGGGRTPTTSPTVRRRSSDDEGSSYVATSNASIPEQNNPSAPSAADGGSGQLFSAEENQTSAPPMRMLQSPGHQASQQQLPSPRPDDFGDDRMRRLSPFELPRSRNEEAEELLDDDDLIYGSTSGSTTGTHRTGGGGRHNPRKVSPLRGNFNGHHHNHHHGHPSHRGGGSPSTSPRIVRASPAPSTLSKSAVPQPWSHNSTSSDSPRQAQPQQPRSAKEMSLMSLPAGVLPSPGQHPRSPGGPISSPASPLRNTTGQLQQLQQLKSLSGEDSLPAVHSIGDVGASLSSQKISGGGGDDDDRSRRSGGVITMDQMGPPDHKSDVLAGSLSHNSSGTFTSHRTTSGRGLRTGSSFGSHNSSSNLSVLTATGGGGAVGFGFRVQAGRPHNNNNNNGNHQGSRMFSASGSEMMPDLSSFGRHSSLGSRDSNDMSSRRSSERRGNSVAFSMDGFFDHESHQQHKLQQQLHQGRSGGGGGGHNNNRSVSFSDAGEETRRDTTMSLLSGRSLRAMSTASSEWMTDGASPPQAQAPSGALLLQQQHNHRSPAKYGHHGVPPAPMSLANFQGRDEGTGPLTHRRAY